MPTMKHPDSPNPIEVDTESVALYAAAGWVVVPKAPKPKALKK